MSALFDKGYVVTAPLLAPAGCDDLLAALAPVAIDGAGTRRLLDHPACRALADTLRRNPTIAPHLPADAVAIQCTLFEKSADRNWLVALHQDLSVPVAEQVADAHLTGWARKEGQWFVQPPPATLEQLLAVRLHLDDCGSDDGPLRVVPGSHRHGRLDGARALALREAIGETTCPVARGAAMLMRPLLLHASSRATGSSRRRVLHFLFGPAAAPFGLRWAPHPL